MKNLAKMKEIQDKISKAPYFQRYKSLSAMGDAVKANLEQLVPPSSAFESARKGDFKPLQEKSMAAALNAPMGLTFIGSKSASFDMGKALQAKKLISEGADPASVWRTHRVGFLDKELTMPFTEVSDKNLKVNLENAKEPGVLRGMFPSKGGLGKDQFIEHPELARELDWGKFHSYGQDMPSGYNGAYIPSADTVKLNIGPTVDLAQMRANAAHEISHPVQYRSGLPVGGSPSLMTFEDYSQAHKDSITGLKNVVEHMRSLGDQRALRRANKALSDAELNASYDAYYNLTGEALAREAANRVDYTDLQRADVYPMAGGKLGGTPVENLIMKYRNQIPNKSFNLSAELPKNK